MRIIPARAGFTRSRPVTVSPTAGSSPLARGLRIHYSARGARDRIIPARAGFTWSNPRNQTDRGGDHPRSRGVYFTTISSSITGVGSSPLARGLRACFGNHHALARIIPARAGFTLTYRSWPAGLGDHPRSRGVYPRGETTIWGARGSSPLARGLRPEYVSIFFSTTDHPRSRGVYNHWTSSASHSRGSSPLARGLHAKTMGNGTGRRDHPRSRGVYTTRRPKVPRTAGSSPLARGLLSVFLPGIGWGRIIPARSGFTP